MFYGLILGIHVLVCLLLCIIVLLQSSKGTGLAGGALGGGAESTVFGGRGAATFLSKATTVFGVGFMVTSLLLTLMGKSSTARAKSAVQEEARQQGIGIPTETAPPTSGLPGTGLPVAGEGAIPMGGGTPAASGTAPGVSLPLGQESGQAPPAGGGTTPVPVPAEPGTTTPTTPTPPPSGDGG